MENFYEIGCVMKDFVKMYIEEYHQQCYYSGINVTKDFDDMLLSFS